jgi:Grap2 and cyclin-D-interacting
MSSSSSSSSDVLAALIRLANSLKELNDQASANQLSHYRHLPPAVVHALDLMDQGAAVVEATATKYTLVGQQQQEQQTAVVLSQMATELLQGCQLVATAALVICDGNVGKADGTNSLGCAQPFRAHVKRTARSIVGAVQNLVQIFVDREQVPEGERENQDLNAAQRTGVVWDACQKVLQKQMPRGNRTAFRRDWMIYQRDCQDTLEEFQALYDEGPVEGDSGELSSGDHDAPERYTKKELPVVQACLYIIKSSRGSLKVTVTACEAVGAVVDNLQQQANGSSNDVGCAGRLQWIAAIHDLVRLVGEGVTDFGSVLYPPLSVDTLTAEINRQATAVYNLVSFILDATVTTGPPSSTLELPAEVTDLAGKIHAAIQMRQEEALKGIAALQ